MKKMTRIASLLLIVIIAVSCATTSPRQKMLVGNWKAVSVDRLDKPASTPSTPQPDSLLPDTARVATPQPTREEERLARFIKMETTASLQINADKTAVKTYRGKTVSVKWKLKKNGTLLVSRNVDTGQKFEQELVKINDTSATVIQRYPEGVVKITYKKIK